jgi:hypothetical protein
MMQNQPKMSACGINKYGGGAGVVWIGFQGQAKVSLCPLMIALRNECDPTSHGKWLLKDVGS